MLLQIPIGEIGSNLPNDVTTSELSDPQRINTLFSRVIGALTITAGLAFIIYFTIGGLTWITAGGDQQKVDAAKKYMTNGVTGLIIVVASYAIIGLVGSVLGFDILDPAQIITNQFIK